MFMDITKKQLTKHVEETKSFNELVVVLYGKTGGNNWRKTKDLVNLLGVDTSKYRVRKYNKEILEPLVKECTTMRDVCRRLGLKVGGGSQAFISRKVKEFGIDCSHFVGPMFPRLKPKDWRKILVKDHNRSRTSGSTLRRCLIAMGRDYKCEAASCSITNEWLGQPITLQVHHCDGDHLNNDPENLMLICPNCHTQTSNWCNNRRA